MAAEMAAGTAACFHCGEPCPRGEPIEVEHSGRRFPVCCHGCRAVSELIFASGLDRYYTFRTSEARKADQDLDVLSEAWRGCDERKPLWGEEQADGRYDLLLQTEGVRCAACAWLIRSRLEPREGIERVQVDLGTGYTRILWDPAKTRLSEIATELARLGYRPHIPIAEEEERARLAERRSAMLRVGVAGLGMMQVMMYAVGLYAGDALGITAGAQRFLEWTSLLVSFPVVFYSGRPFFVNAATAFKARRLNMDVPVALAIAVAFVASCVNFLRGEGAVYFDSVVMFIFFLSSARYIQMVQRHRSLQASTALARLLPEWARRVRGDATETVLASDLEVGDRVRVPAGEAFPADGVIVDGRTEVDEALLTGEPVPVARESGDPVVGGSVNRSQAVDIEVTATGEELAVSALGRMVLKAGAAGGRSVLVSERIAGVFIFGVLVVAALTLVGWMMFEPSGAMSAVLAVLVVSCPCALSLATPAALAAASGRLLGSGVLMTRSEALEALTKVRIAVFDKTGTLTRGLPEIVDTRINPAWAENSLERVRAIAAALEAHSAHPISHAFRKAGAVPRISDVGTVAHAGVSGMIDGERWRIGSAAFAGQDGADKAAEPGNRVWLANDKAWVARFELSDELRPGAGDTLAALQELGLKTVIASGDSQANVQRIAYRLGVEEHYAAQDPESKMERVRGWQAAGQGVLMVGDGVNDAPVLATADVSMTVSGASELANSVADFVLTGESLAGVIRVLETARAVRRIVRQNLGWAIAYNIAALPLAVSGVLEPWMAALGMSLSSLAVVANSSRLGRMPAVHEGGPDTLTEAAPA